MQSNKKIDKKKTTQYSLVPKLLVLAVAQALVNFPAEAASIEVTSNLDDGSDCTLREAITTINEGADQANGCVIDSSADTLGTNDAINFSDTVVGSTITLNGTELEIKRDVSINLDGENTTIDGNNASRVIHVNGEYTQNPALSHVTLDHLTITGGNVTTPSITGWGGGVNVSGADIGGGYTTELIISNSTVSGNTTMTDGGGISQHQAGLTIINSTVSGNTANVFGGGISSFTFASGKELEIINSTVTGNTADSAGGIMASYSIVKLANSTVSGNTSNRDGGGIALLESNVNLTNSTVSGNSSGMSGGGFAAVRSYLVLTNSTVSGNSAVAGGGMNVGFASATLVNSTVTNNSADEGGGILAGYGITTYDSSYVGARIYLENSMVANSLRGGDCLRVNPYGSHVSGSVYSGRDSIIEDGSCGSTAMAVDPLLGPLADNGGSTLTHALLPGSPAINNGTSADATDTDQRGFLAEGVRDIGAYEFIAAQNALSIDKLINNMERETPVDSAQLLTGSLYRQFYRVTNTSPYRLYQVRVFENGNPVCNVYTLDPGETRDRCNTVQSVLPGDQHVEVTVNARISGTADAVSATTDSYYTGISGAQGGLSVTHYLDDDNADTPGQAQSLGTQPSKVLFRVENTSDIELYRVKTYHDPVSPVNSGWQQQCDIGPLKPGQVRYCKRDITLSDPGLNHSMGRVQGANAFVAPTDVINSANPTYFIVP